ncbi:MAG: MBL fold metallo-hydrolase [Alphaproteobacteria bacterium]|nr:MBL fold metallo-hydrolase [Alphaproteobacteria bacterium]
MAVTVTFWGVRGSIPCCSAEYTEYGGNTSCVQVDLDGQTLILDAGSGLRTLGDLLFQQNKTDVTLLISHTHWDHICGFPFFRPIFEKTSHVDLYVPRQQNDESTKEIFAMLMSAPFFPLSLHAIPSVLHFHDFHASDHFDLFDGKVKVQTIPLTHPNGACGYRVFYRDKSISYISDYEHGSAGSSEELAAFVNGSDLMIYDAMYTPEEYEHFKGWGHSTWQQAAHLTRIGNVKLTALYHHAPVHNDAMMRQIELLAQADDSRLFAAKENTSITL